MAISQKEEARALNTDEHELVVKSHHPNLQALPDGELADLVKLIRARREKAKSQANQRHREMRGKAAPKGKQPSKADEGSKVKVAVLAMAMRRLNGEVVRRRQMVASVSMADNARKALAMKRGAQTKAASFNSRHAHEGMHNASNKRAQDLVRPMETGRLRKAASVAQAKRDGR
jgi:hypothetical protein